MINIFIGVMIIWIGMSLLFGTWTYFSDDTFWGGVWFMTLALFAMSVFSVFLGTGLYFILEGLK